MLLEADQTYSTLSGLGALDMLGFSFGLLARLVVVNRLNVPALNNVKPFYDNMTVGLLQQNPDIQYFWGSLIKIEKN